MDDRNDHQGTPAAVFSRWRLKTFAILMFICGSAIVLLALVSHYTLLEGFAELERRSKQQQLDRFASLLAHELELLHRTAGDYAGWDEAYRFVQDGNQQFIAANLHAAVFPQLRLNILLYLDRAGTIRYGKAFDFRRAKEVPLPSQMEDFLERQELLLAPHDSTGMRGILQLPDGLLLTVSYPVLKNDFSGPSKGNLIVGRFLDAEEIARLARLLQKPMEIYPTLAGNLPPDVREALPILRGSQYYTRAFGNDRIAGYALFRDIFGKDAFVVKIEEPRRYYQQGLKSIELFLVWAVFISGAASLAIFILIDRLKIGKERLRQAHNLLEGVLIGSEDLIVAIDAGYRYLVFNRAYLDQYRLLYGAEAKTGGSIADTLAGAPQACERELVLWERALHGEAFTVVSECGHDGRQRTFEMKFTPLRDEVGAVVAAACIARDMTRRLQEERALRESEQRFRAFFNNVAVGTLQLDGKGRFNRVNDRFCRMTGYAREELLQMTPTDLAYPEDGEREPFQRFLLNEALSSRAELRYVRKDGAIIWVEVAASLVRDECGSPQRTIAIVQEISARKRLEDELRTATRAAEAASQAKSEFLATMSHEIRTPMTVFMLALEHLLEIDRDPAHREFLELADSAARRLRSLIEDILDFSRIEAGRLEIDEQLFNVRECIGHAVDLLIVSARDKGLRLNMQVTDNVPRTLMGDSNRIEQVLINLIGNAVKFTEDGEITVAVDCYGDFLRVVVSDTGIGISEEKRDLLFRHFNQGDSSLTRKYGGTGLGLAVSKGLVDLMGGQIGCYSREGRGSVFCFTVPLKVASAPETIAGAAENTVANNHPRILLVEDEPTERTMIQLLLDQNGWRVEIATNGEEALALWRAGKHNLIFMEVEMLGMDGLEATRQLRWHEQTQGGEACIIGLMSETGSATEQACLAAGMDSCIRKPLRMGDLFAAIDKCFSDHGRERRRRMAQGE